MPAGVKVEVKGVKEAMKIIDSLEPRVQKKIIDSGIQRSLTPMIRKGKQNYLATPHPFSGKDNSTKGQNKAAKSLSKIKLKRNVIGYRAKPSKKKGGSLVHLLDQGTRNRKTKSGANRGQIKGTRFWTRAIDSEKSGAIKNAETNIVKALNAKINSSIKKYGIKI